MARRHTITDDEHALLLDLYALGYPQPEPEVRFHPSRQWRLDHAWREAKVAIEVQGGRWVTSGHSTGRGIERDAEKLAEAQVLGWIVLPLTDGLLRDGRALSLVERALALRGVTPTPAPMRRGRRTA